MSAGFTFGSLGDIITVSQLVFRLARALDDCHGSAKEYQGLRKDVEVFGQILVQVIATYELFDSSSWLQGIDNITKTAVGDCAVIVQESLDHLSKYDESLRPGGCGNPLKDTFKKIKWLADKVNVEDLRKKLKTGSEKITLLLSLASKVSARLDCRTMLYRINEVQCLLNDQRTRHEAIVTLMEAQLQRSRDDICVELSSIHTSLDRQEQTTQGTLFVAKCTLSAVTSLQQMVSRVLQAVMALHDLASQTTYLRSLDPTKGLPVTLEDALGNIREIPMDWLKSWEALHNLIAHSFENQKGYQLVLSNRYRLEDGVLNNVLETHGPFSLRRVMKINMTMIFVGTELTNCPRCHVANEAERGRYSHCATPGCGFLSMMCNPGSSKRIFKASTSGADNIAENGLASEHPSNFSRVRLLLDDEQWWRKDIRSSGIMQHGCGERATRSSDVDFMRRAARAMKLHRQGKDRS